MLEIGKNRKGRGEEEDGMRNIGKGRGEEEEQKIDWEMREEENEEGGEKLGKERKRRIGRRREEYSIRYNNSICMIV